jgi:thimet oligopeptidase
MAASTGPRVATTGRLPFTLSAEALRSTTAAILEEAQRELDRLAAATEPPTVENFLRPLDALLLRAYDASSHGSLLFQVHPDESVRAAAREASEAADRFLNRFRLREEIYRRLRALDAAQLDPTTRYAVEKLARELRRAGVERPPAEREEIVRLVNRIDQTANEFSENIANGDRSIVVEGPDALRGLPPDYLAAHPPDAQGRIRITTRYPDAFPVMSYCADGEVRRRLLFEVLNIAYPKNLEVLGRLLAERAELARRLGYPDYASYATEDKMMARPEAVAAFLDRLVGLLRDGAERDLERFLARKQRDQPAARSLEPWDAGFWGDGLYDTYLRQEVYGVDPRVLRAYLPYGAVRDGLFRLCEELFGLTITPHPTPDLWHPSVAAYDMSRGGRPVGRFYLDLIPRAGKYNHAAEFSVRNGLSTGDLPQAALICNFLDPNTPPEKARMEYRDVVTFFHEFGHLLHALFSGHGPWMFTSTAHIEWDFVEAPSQLFEEWAHDAATLARFARNPDTGEPIPADLLARIAAAEAMGRPSRQLRQVALARISLELYRRDPRGMDTSEVFRDVWNATYPLPWRDEYHSEADWGHLTGYSACYYTYLWSAVIARDLLSPFQGKGSLTDLATADRYAAEILSPGSTRPAAELVRRFLGREFSFSAYERWALEGSTVEARPPPAVPAAPGPRL